MKFLPSMKSFGNLLRKLFSKSKFFFQNYLLFPLQRKSEHTEKSLLFPEGIALL